jgi:hypothetical protein
MNSKKIEQTIHSGSQGERLAQERFGTGSRALAFYQNQMLSELNALMQEFIAGQEMVFIATADAQGNADCSFRSGAPGFVYILNSQTVAYPEYRGNGVLASVGNILENPHIGMMFIDFFKSTIGLHVNGKAQVIDNERLADVLQVSPKMREAANIQGGRHPTCWIVVDIEEAFIHCSKHVPLFKKIEKQLHWGTDDERLKGGDYFKVKGGA